MEAPRFLQQRLADPVTGAIAVFGVTQARVELVTGLAFAVVLEAVACFAWLLALRPATVPVALTQAPVTPVPQASHAIPVTPVTPPSHAVMTRDEPADQAAPMHEPQRAEQRDELTRVMAEIAAGRLRATVNEIRKFLGCSQANAAAIRKQVAQATT